MTAEEDYEVKTTTTTHYRTKTPSDNYMRAEHGTEARWNLLILPWRLGTGSVCKALAVQARGPEFSHQHHRKS